MHSPHAEGEDGGGIQRTSDNIGIFAITNLGWLGSLAALGPDDLGERAGTMLVPRICRVGLWTGQAAVGFSHARLMHGHWGGYVGEHLFSGQIWLGLRLCAHGLVSKQFVGEWAHAHASDLGAMNLSLVTLGRVDWRLPFMNLSCKSYPSLMVRRSGVQLADEGAVGLPPAGGQDAS